ncbi:MAG: ribosome recycling factor [Aquisalinus sp.]|nr:ribosome recycling factor [Aquisalinus sp.]
MADDTSGPDMTDLKRRMEGAIDSLKTEFSGLRTGRASANLLDNVNVNAYGSMMPMNQVGTVNVPEPRMLSVQVWDQSLVGAVEKAIRDSGLGVNPVTDGQNVRVPLPALTEERRVELTKIAGKYAEQARIAVRNVRRDGMESLKKADGISEDEQKRLADEVQKLTDSMIKEVDASLETKEQEIMQV